MRPRRVDLLLLVDTGLSEAEVRLLDIGEWSEEVPLDHVHGLLNVGHDNLDDELLIFLELLLQVCDHVEAILLRLLVLLLVLVVEDLGADGKLFEVRFLRGLPLDGDAVFAGSLRTGRRIAHCALRSG